MRGFIFLTVLLCSLQIHAEPFVDIHTHYNWDQSEITTPEEAIAVLKKHGVILTIVSSTPSLEAVKLRKAGGDMIMPFFTPYITPMSRQSWMRDEGVLIQAREALKSGDFFGIGEVHIISGLGPRRDNKIFEGLLELAVEFDVPVMIHTEASDYRFFKPVCQKHSKVRFLWAHAGSILGPEQVAKLLDACSNVWVEVSARDPWHYGSFLHEDGSIPQNWMTLFQTYADRVMVGTDPVWKAHQVNRWEEANEGWLHYDKLYNFHMQWLDQLPDELRKKLKYQNGLKFLRRDGSGGSKNL